MAEKSGIEMLEEILFRLDNIEKRLNVLDQNVKTIANAARLSELVEKAVSTGADGWAKAIVPDVQPPKPTAQPAEKGFKNFTFVSSDGAKDPNRQDLRTSRTKAKPKSILTKGKISFDMGEKVVPLQGISVKIYNDKDKLVKQTKTNRAGHWMSHLNPGKYVALFEGEVAGKKLLPQNKNFEVPNNLPEGKKEFEVL